MNKIIFSLCLITSPALGSAVQSRPAPSETDLQATEQKKKLEAVIAAPDIITAMKPLSDADIKDLKELIDAKITDATVRGLADSAVTTLKAKQKTIDFEVKRVRAGVRGRTDAERQAAWDERKERAGIDKETPEEREARLKARAARTESDTRRVPSTRQR